MGALTRAYDWSASPLGEPGSWPQSLRTAVRIVLNTNHPMFIWWGPELIQFYNDAYRQTMGPERHPSALGQRGRECWAEIWPIIGPQIEQVMSGGGATWHENQLVPVTRYGRLEQVYWTYGYSPIDEDDGIGGVLVVCRDVTRDVVAADGLAGARGRTGAGAADRPDRRARGRSSNRLPQPPVAGISADSRAAAGCRQRDPRGLGAAHPSRGPRSRRNRNSATPSPATCANTACNTASSGRATVRSGGFRSNPPSSATRTERPSAWSARTATSPSRWWRSRRCGKAKPSFVRSPKRCRITSGPRHRMVR